jgi:hypothetical protein
MIEIYTLEKIQQIRKDYCKHNGYSQFNNRVINDYTDYLELRLMEALSQANEATKEQMKHKYSY